MGKMFDLLKEGLEEAIEFHKGKVKLRTREVFIPAPPKEYSPNDIKNLRNKLKLTQEEFSKWLNVSLNSVQSWEQGTRTPNHSSLRLLQVFEKDFSFVKTILVNKKAIKNTHKSSVQSCCSSKSSLIAKGRHI